MTFISYAQNYEDVMLRRALKDVDKGFYIDVGANDPIVDSVTKSFYDTGWRGINIEPVNEWFKKLQQDRPDDINLKLAVGANEGEVNFYEVVGTGLSTMDESVAKRHEQESSFDLKRNKVSMARLTTICEQYANSDIHFLKIDVEGGEESVLRGFNLKKFRPWIILVESTLPSTQIEKYEDWEPILFAADYEYIKFDGLNRFYVAKEHKKIKTFLIVPPNVFDGFVLSGTGTSSFHVEIANIRTALQETKTQRQQLETQVQRIQDEAVQREEKLREKETKQLELLLSMLEKETRLQETETQRQQLETQVQRIQDEAVQREEKLREKEESNHWLNNEWNAAKQKVDELHQSNHHWWLEAERLTKELHTVHNSKSWRITWPIRKLMQVFKWLLRLPIRLVLWFIRLPKRTVRWLLVKVMGSVIKHPALKVRAMNRLHNYPNLKEKLRRFAQARGLIAMQGVSSIIPIQPIPESTKLSSSPSVSATEMLDNEADITTNEDAALELKLSHLNPSARRIYREIKTAMAQHEQENL